MRKEDLFRVTKSFVTALIIAAPLTTKAQSVSINVAGAEFTRPLIEKLADEYQKQNPSFSAKIVSNAGESDATVSITSTEDASANTLARYFLLPIANPDNTLLSDKKIQKGLNDKLSREIFVEKSYDDFLDGNDKKELPGTVYTLGGSHSATTKLLANSLNVDVNNIKGKKILGKEENVISVVKGHPDAISVDVASLIYDPSTQKPVSGITILPSDLDGNGKVSDAERSALSSLPALTAYLASQSKTGVPTGSVQLSSHSKGAEEFLVWATTEGQKYLNSLGYLSAGNAVVAQNIKK